MTAAAGGGAKLSMGSDSAILSGKTVTLEADGVCSIKGKSKLKLQESEGAEGTKERAQSSGDEGAEGADPIVFRGRAVRKGKAGEEPASSPSNSSSTKAIDEGPVDKSAEEPKRDKLWVRIDMSPEQAGKDKFVLSSSDGSFRVIKTAADDKIPNDDSLDLFFGEVDTSLRYTLEVAAEDGSSFTLFEDVAYSELGALVGEPDGPDEAQDLGTYVGEAEQVDPTRGRNL